MDYDRLPKIELHLHLEGAIPLPDLWSRVVRHQGTGQCASLEALRERFRYRDFAHFIETWVWKNQFLRDTEDYRYIGAAVARHLRAQNVLYAELFFTPGREGIAHIPAEVLADSIHEGFSTVPEVELRLIADFVRDLGPEAALAVLDSMSDPLAHGILGIGIGGSEQRFPPAPFAKLYQRARDLGLHTNAHAGEAAGPESVWSAIDDLGAERLGHATRAIEDDALVTALIERRIPLEMCPLSNVRTGAVASIDAHPLRKLFDRGARVTVNTDDPAMFGNSLAEELELLVRVHGFSGEELRTLMVNAAEACWAEPEDRERLAERIASDPGWT